MVVLLDRMNTYSLEPITAQIVATISPIVQTQMPMSRVIALYSAISATSIAPSFATLIAYFSHGMN